MSQTEDRADNCVLVADITGFTSMSEKLMAHGKAGAEVLSSILGRIFSRAVCEIYSRGGIIVQFEGDALIALFPLEQSADAMAAAEALRHYFHNSRNHRTVFGDLEVTARLALTGGPVEWGIVGERRLVHFVRGEAIKRAFDLLSSEACRKLEIDESFPLIPGNEPHSLLRKHPLDNSSRILRSVAERFVPESILASKLTGEFRDIASVFVTIRSSAEQEAHDAINTILQKAEFYGGYVSGLFFTTGEPVIPILFGAPVSWENNESRGCRLACHLIGAFPDSIRCGIVSGRVYAGMTGSSKRCTYTVYGDTINTCARLLNQARWGEVLVSEETSRNVIGEFAWGRWKNCSLRGKQDDTMAVGLLRCQDSGIQRTQSGVLCGRSSELRFIRKRLDPLEHGTFAGITTVYGEAGIGKSMLIHHAVSEGEKAYRVFYLRCDDILRTSLNPLEDFFSDLFGQSGARSAPENKQIFEEGLKHLWEEMKSRISPGMPHPSGNLLDFKSTLGSVIGHHWENSSFQKMNPEERFENIAAATGMLIGALAAVGPVVLVLEDLQWMDSDSKRFLGMISAEIARYPVALLVSSRYNDDGSMPETGIEQMVDRASIHLKPIDSQASRSIIKVHFPEDTDDDMIAFILARTRGNPFYINQFCVYLRNSLSVEYRDSSWRLTSRKLEVPSGIRSILVARIDRLPGGLKRIAQTASVLGQEFDLDVLAGISGDKDVESLLWEGTREQLWRRTRDATFTFSHALYRDAAYGMLLDKEARKLHKKAANAFISLNSDDPVKVAGKIAFHMESSGRIPEATEWAWKALLQADDNCRLHESLQWTERLQSMILSSSKPGSRPHLLCNVLFRKNNVLSKLGMHPEQEDNLLLLTTLCEVEEWADRTADLLTVQAHFCSSTGHVDEAFELYIKGLDSAEAVNDVESQAMILGNLGILHRGSGHMEKAMQCYEKALMAFRKIGDRRGEANILGNLALLLRHRGRKKEAEKHYLQALRIHRGTGNRRGEGYILNGLGNLSGDDGEALEWFRQALSINREVGDRKAVGIALGNIGQIESSRGNHESAKEHLYRALDIFREMSNLPLQAGTLNMIGEMHMFRDELEVAAQRAAESMEISRRAKRKRIEILATVLLGRITALMGNIESATLLYLESCAQIEEYGFSSAIDEHFAELRLLLLQGGNVESSLPWPGNWDPMD